jgi:preprotein translocase subunit SecE
MKFFTNIVQFFRDVRAELGKVIWPSRRDAIRYTITVVVFSVVLAAILGAADFGLLQGFQALIRK